MTCGAIYEEYPVWHGVGRGREAGAGTEGMLHGIVARQGVGGMAGKRILGLPLVPWFCFAPQSMQWMLVLCTETNK